VSTSQEVEVQVLEVDSVKRRISLGLKQTMRNPWELFVERYPVGAVIEGEVKNKTEFGLFLGLEGDVDGMVHLSDLDWKLPGEQVIDNFKKGDMVKAVVLDVDVDKERISLGIKQLAGDPMAGDSYRKGQTVTVTVTEVTTGGIEVRLGDDEAPMTAFIRKSDLSDLDWTAPGEEVITRYQKGEMVKAQVLDVDVEKERISLGIKQLAGDPMAGDAYRKGQTVTVTVTEVTSGGIEVRLGDDEAPMTAFIRKSDLSRDRADQRPERFAVGDRVDAQVANVDKGARRLSLSIKALEMAEEKEAIEQFGSSDSGASLGDILGAALREKGQPKD
ncbi:MAG: S1 RNA-binding domain-containing protein, partial [Phenylobacterium sp.]|nr:S1 RNA-binding domain-containing protein [Phenylobacterium sp.]